MIDRIVPRTTHKIIKELEENYEIEDKIPVTTESYIQWIIEDDFINSKKPPWDIYGPGVIFVKNSAQYEDIKLRIFNTTRIGFSFFSKLMNIEIICQALKNKQIHVKII